ncbi:MAG: hypothetical protein LBC89_02890 [Bacteroidales bacterium]|jgi:hypothetical protein|nr:hypothetical protein [Bacteroidales bacterium]
MTDTFIYHSFNVNIDSKGIDIVFHFEIEGLANFFPRLFIPHRHFYNYDNLSKKDLDYLVFNIGMIELISYWKATCSPNVVIKNYVLTDEQQKWWKKLYFNGLGEFFYINKMDVDEEKFMTMCNVQSVKSQEPRAKSQDNNLSQPCPATTTTLSQPCPNLVPTLSQNSTIVPVGGGKDSCVTLEKLKATGHYIRPMIINPRGATLNCIKVAGFTEWESIIVYREISPALLELNKRGFLNGHTPFSAMLAFVSLLCSAVSGIPNIVLSNEASANEATDPVTGANHQYSKSLEFENDFRDYVSKYISKEMNYYSFLRPYSELEIAEMFAQYPQYHSVFRSCNVGSKQDIWCCNCAKCLFAFIILSPFIEKEKLSEIFGENLLDKPSLRKEFEELTGIAAVKPFECVGTIAEVNQALAMFKAKYPDDRSALLFPNFRNTST